MKNSILQTIALKEGVSYTHLEKGIRDGTIVVPINEKRPKKINPIAIGKGLTTKINCNIGTSPERADLKLELEKLKAAVEAKTDTIMDLSTGGDIPEIRKAIIDASSVPVGTVPIYEASFYAQMKHKSFVELKPKDFLNVIENHLADGVDFITVHCGITLKNMQSVKNVRRLTGVVSRGGSMIIEWMRYNRKENPLYEYYDEILQIAKDYNACLSLGDGLRPGSLHDATDEPQILELLVIGELVARARAEGVQVIVEGPGHIPINEIEVNVKLEKLICDDAPFYVLGPLVTDIGCGYDHITSAIGGALASYYGADFLCYVTPSEHLGLPTVEDVRQGVIASRIAAHAGDVARGKKNARDWDDKISKARAELNWQKMIALSVDPKQARKIYEAYPLKAEGVCTMCGEFCALKKSKEWLHKTTKNSRSR
ncbi:MAG: phosphomethylpyrimidine synthase ThiC [candidate division WOR-3 bacterium]|nr:phosphomethylpyrimidine synthase ThiC [candidate division WOR-3 bacterium]